MTDQVRGSGRSHEKEKQLWGQSLSPRRTTNNKFDMGDIQRPMHAAF